MKELRLREVSPVPRDDDRGSQIRTAGAGTFGTQPGSLPGISSVLGEDQESGHLHSTSSSTADLLCDPRGGGSLSPQCPQPRNAISAATGLGGAGAASWKWLWPRVTR